MNPSIARVATFVLIAGLMGSGADPVAAATTVLLNPGDNIQAKVNANPVGTIFKFTAGGYNRQHIIPKTGNVFDGQGVATLDGKHIAKKAFEGTADNVTIKTLLSREPAGHIANSAVGCAAWQQHSHSDTNESTTCR